MSGVLYLFMSVASLVLWSKAGCAVCINSLDIGFWGKPWYLWGAVFYALMAMLAFRIKKCRLVTAIMAGGIIFHVSLIYGTYSMTNYLCHYCIGFAFMELVAIIAYQFENPKLRDHFFTWGPARSSMVVAATLFFINPVNHSIQGVQVTSGVDPYVMVASNVTLTGQLTDNRDITKSNENTTVQPDKEQVMDSDKNVTMNDDFALKVYGQDGGQITLSLKNRPVLFFAWWCPHCDDALKNIAKLPPWKRPYPVVTYLEDENDDFKIKQKLKANGLSNTPYYVYKDTPPIQGVPSLLWHSNGALQDSYDMGFKNLDETMSMFVSEPKWGYNASFEKNVAVITPGAIKYRPINNPSGVLRYLAGKNSMLAESKYLEALDSAGKKYDVDPKLLLSITGQEQSFVPKSWSKAEEMVKNPFNVYGSWQVYAPGFSVSAEIAAKTVNRLSADCPAWMNPIQWIDSPENPNCRYAEDTNWWKGVEKFYSELNNV
ncbi:MAG: hypothetical protein A4E56_00418 [Pelotomaculum sp. PtaU1.Bin065]|nr:MAG: hypothetical protein A4E56_00418 [Pelotomaculum sp. PtaU1.Bin065]